MFGTLNMFSFVILSLFSSCLVNTSVVFTIGMLCVLVLDT